MRKGFIFHQYSAAEHIWAATAFSVAFNSLPFDKTNESYITESEPQTQIQSPALHR